MKRWLFWACVLGFALALLMLLPTIAFADNCSGLYDCWYSAAGAAAAAAGAGAAAAVSGGLDDGRCVVRISSEKQTLCPNETARFTGFGEPLPGTLKWSGGGKPATGEGNYFVTRFPEHGKKTVTATFTSKKGKTCSTTTTVKVNELSGGQWVERYPGSRDTADLVSPFRENVEAFIAALRWAGADVDVAATYRPAPRAYLMHYSYQIAKKDGLDPHAVPAGEGVEICWEHHNDDGTVDEKSLAESRAAAAEMVALYKIVHFPPAYPSRHSERVAIDMNIDWSGILKVAWGPRHPAMDFPGATTSGPPHAVPSSPTVDIPARPGALPPGVPPLGTVPGAAGMAGGAAGVVETDILLWEVGASYSVIKHPTDPPHWSDTGM